MAPAGPPGAQASFLCGVKNDLSASMSSQGHCLMTTPAVARRLNPDTDAKSDNSSGMATSAGTIASTQDVAAAHLTSMPWLRRFRDAH
jgi:hypothetical protein